MPGARRTVSERVVAEVARATGRDEITLPPLYDVIDPDALDALVDSARKVEVSFVYAGYEITVESDERISLEEGSGAPPASEAPTAD